MLVVIKHTQPGVPDSVYNNVGDWQMQEPGVFVLVNENKQPIAVVPIVNVASLNFPEHDTSIVLAQNKVSLT